MFKQWTLLTLLLGFAGASQAAPLDSSDTVYIDGLPCSSACQSYMAWYRSVAVRPAAPVSRQSRPPQLVQRSPKPKADRTTRPQEKGSKSAQSVRGAKKAGPNSVEMTPAKAADLPPPNSGEAKSVSPEKVAAPPRVSDTSSDASTPATPDQTALATTEEPTTAPPVSEQKAHSNIGSEEGARPAETAAITGATPNVADQLVAILLVRPDINSLSDLNNKIVAIDVSRSDSVPSVRAAIVAAGAADVQISESGTLALVRVIDGEVPAAVVTIASSPQDAETWFGVTGFKVLQIPLSPAAENRRPG